MNLSDDYLVRAYDGESGNLMWNLREGGASCDGQAQSIVATPDLVVVAGRLCHENLLRAYDPTSGALLWEDRLTFAQPVPAVVYGGEESVVWLGSGFLRVYDPDTAALEWELRDMRITPRATLDGTTLVVVEDLASDPPGDNGGLAAYDLGSGELLWRRSPNTDVAVKIFTVAAANDLVLTYAEPRGEAETGAPTVGAGLLENGDSLWQSTRPVAGFIEAFAQGLGRAFAVGVDGEFMGEDRYRNRFHVAAYDEVTGAILWSDIRGEFRDEEACAVALRGRRLAVVGYELELRVYDAITGALVHETVDSTESATSGALATDGDWLYLAGEVRSRDDGVDDHEIALRAFRESARPAR